MFNEFWDIPTLRRLRDESVQKIVECMPSVDPMTLGYRSSIELNPEISQPIINEIKRRENEKMKTKYSTRFECPRCFEKKTNFIEVQKRRGDEGAALQITCQVCGHQWDKND